MEDRKRTFETLARKYAASSVYMFGQLEFQQMYGDHPPFGLCAGLVRAWVRACLIAGDPIRSIVSATPQAIKDVFLWQARSVYLDRLPDSEMDLTRRDAALLQFKYGCNTPAEVHTLEKSFGVATTFELDIVLQHGHPILRKWQHVNTIDEALTVFQSSPAGGVFLIVLRYVKASRPSGWSGHRCALAFDPILGWVFYDPSRGQVTFDIVANFRNWLLAYWESEGWDRKRRRCQETTSPIQIYQFAPLMAPDQESLIRDVELKLSQLSSSIFQLIRHADQYSATWLSVVVKTCQIELGDL